MLANVALPSFLPHSFTTLMGIFVIAGIEGWFVMRILQLRYAESYLHALSANWRSTLIGIPLAWALWVAGLIPVSLGLSAVGLEVHPAIVSTATQTAITGGLIPTEWMPLGSAAAWLVMLIPFWMGSAWIERRTIAKRLPDREWSQISHAVVCANLASYSLFLLFGGALLFQRVVELPAQKAHFEKFDQRRKALKQ